MVDTRRRWLGGCTMQVDPIRNSGHAGSARQVLAEIARSMAHENGRQFLHGKQKRAPTNFARRSITVGAQPFLRGPVVLLIVPAPAVSTTRSWGKKFPRASLTDGASSFAGTAPLWYSPLRGNRVNYYKLFFLGIKSLQISQTSISAR